MTTDGVHITHCCPLFGCKYGDEDCVVAIGVEKPRYQCEDCCCAAHFPDLVKDAERWWAALQDEDKRMIYHFNTARV